MFGAGLFLIGLSYLDCTQTKLAVLLLVLAVSMSGFVYSGYFVNHMDIAPQYAGTLMGIGNGIAAISGFVAPYIASRVTESVSELHHLNLNISNNCTTYTVAQNILNDSHTTVWPQKSKGTVFECCQL